MQDQALLASSWHPGGSSPPSIAAMVGMPGGHQLGHAPELLCEDGPMGLGKDPLAPMSSLPAALALGSSEQPDPPNPPQGSSQLCN